MISVDCLNQNQTTYLTTLTLDNYAPTTIITSDGNMTITIDNEYYDYYVTGCKLASPEYYSNLGEVLRIKGEEKDCLKWQNRRISSNKYNKAFRKVNRHYIRIRNRI